MLFARTSFCVLVLLLVTLRCIAFINYTATFEESAFIPGNATITDLSADARIAPSNELDGSSAVLAAGAHAAFASQSLQLVPQSSGSFTVAQYAFDLGTPATDYLTLSLQLMLDSFATGSGGAFIPDNQSDYFSILFDTPGVERIDFTSSGSEGFGRILMHGGTEAIGVFNYGSLIDITIGLNLLANTWSILMTQDSSTIVDVPAGSVFFEEFGQNTYSGMLESVRLALADGAAETNHPEAVLDNLSLVPEPSAIYWLALAGALIPWFFHSRCCNQKRGKSDESVCKGSRANSKNIPSDAAHQHPVIPCMSHCRFASKR